MIKLLTDENIPPAFVGFLRNKGFDIKDIRELRIHGASGSFTLDLAVAENPLLTDPEKKDLEKVASVSGLYCQGCRQCLGQCPEHLPIPDLMRAYMYTYAYRNLTHAQDLVISLNLPDRVCEDCTQCPVKCSVGFNVSRKIRDVVRLREIPSEFIG